MKKKSFDHSSQPSPNALTTVKGKYRCSTFENSNIKPESGIVREEFKPFVFEGFVSIDGSDFHSIGIFRDTGASQSLLLEGVLPLSSKTSTGSDVLIQGVGLEFFKVPLHEVHLRSDLVSGPIVVGLGLPCQLQMCRCYLGMIWLGGRWSLTPFFVITLA